MQARTERQVVTREHVLIVTTDWMTSRGCEHVLELAGYRVTAHVTVGDVALADLGDGDPELALIENDIRNMRVVRACESAGVPMVYVHRPLTGAAWNANAPRLEGRPVAHLIAPFQEAQLVSTVATALGRSSAKSLQAVVSRRTWLADADSTPTARGVQTLTRRQRQVVHLLLGGGSVATIAEDLELSQITIRGHLNRIYQKLDVTSQIDLGRAMRNARKSRGRESRVVSEDEAITRTVHREKVQRV